MKTLLLNTAVRCLIDQLYRIELADDDQVNEDFAVELMENISAELQALDTEELAELTKVISEMAGSENDQARREYLESFAESFGLE